MGTLARVVFCIGIPEGLPHELKGPKIYASNQDDALASAHRLDIFRVHEKNSGSGAYSATWLERQSYLPCGTAL
jgi:hypothetical protein